MYVYLYVYPIAVILDFVVLCLVQGGTDQLLLQNFYPRDNGKLVEMGETSQLLEPHKVG